jgi:hypothetical protein
MIALQNNINNFFANKKALSKTIADFDLYVLIKH